ncbi:uncharacterized protein J4E92_001542 [Alternaria infectoria]|uniref:uncharacterized protein n=1 Tax=Alternaria infectoria TaxID=45303 RepID=UPI00221F3635|nr:uncharacterized protein J4E92_001542 [Alternaria infectoria]KAI4936817.1 hypothetical protein J4E92_001542 [Alternaria infectoria]
MYNFTTFDVMADLTFGESLHLLDNAEYNTWIQVIFKGIKREKLVTKRLEKGRVSEGVDLWDLVLQQEDKGKAGLTRPVMDMNGELFMLAGTETTATLLSGLTYLLLVHSESMAKLVEEIRTTFNSSDDMSMEVTAGLPYLNACMKEAFRHYPPVPIGLPHLTPAEGSTICGYYIPPNTNVAASHLAMYSSSDNFRLPERFIPERWLGDPRFASDERSALQPFHVGPRDCLGKNMALHEMRLIMSKVLFNFNLELLPECRDWIADQKIYSLWEKTPLMVKIKDAVVVAT